MLRRLMLAILALLFAAPAWAADGVVSAADPRAAEAGREILRAGGSATDAAIAMMLALNVVEPQSSGIGGGGFLVHAGPDGATSIDGRETAPASARPDRFLAPDGTKLAFMDAVPGGISIGIPGNIRLAEAAHKRWGKLPWKRLFAPAIRLAAQGYQISPALADRLKLTAKVMTGFPAARALYFGKDGNPLPAGTVIRNPALAKAFQTIATKGAAGFYSGPVGAAITTAVATAPRHPARLDARDLAGYRVQTRAALCAGYRGYRICGMGPPSSGGVAILQMLGMLERFDLPGMGPDDPRSWHLIAEAMRLAYADRNTYLADPDFVPVPVKGLLDPGYIAGRSALIRIDATMARALPGTPPGAESWSYAKSGEVPSTTNFAAADGRGEAVSWTSTVESSFGSFVMASGFFLNNELTDFSFLPETAGKPVANRLEPGKRPMSAMSPTLVYAPDGKLVLALGSAGGPRIIMHVLKTLVGVIDWKKPVGEAIALPNIYRSGDAILVEQGTPLEAMVPALTKLGQTVSAAKLTSKVNAVQRTAEGWTGGADPRSEGVALAEMERFPNLVTMFFTRAAEKGDAPFLWEKYAGRWRALSWAATAEAVARVAEALTELGLQRGDRVLLLSRNRREWCIADLGIMAAGGITVPAYVTGTPADQAHILADSGAKIAIVQLKQAGDLDMALAQSPDCRHVIMIEPSTPLPEGHVGHNWSDLLSRQAGNVQACTAVAASLTRDDLACLIYTSGTGGTPKGVQQHHGMILHNVEGCHAIIADDFPAAPDRFLSFLPLSHSYEHSAGQFLPIGLGGEIWYAESLERLAGNIAEAKPTVMVVVPRLFEVLRDKIIRALTERGRMVAWITRQALALAARDNEKRGDKLRRMLVSRTIAPVVRQRFGGSIKAMVSGGAPLTPEVGRFFELMGLPVLQGYGQTEAGPVVSCNRPSKGIAVTTVGPALPGTELRIAEDGEILVRGENVMHGYWQRPGDTAQALVDGWLHTGDVGIIDEAGRLKITDRKKDIIVNDKGENVAPQRIEGMLALQPEIAQAMVFGDRRPHLVGLIVPDPDWSRTWATAHGVADEALLRNNPAYVAALQTAVDRVSKTLSPLEKVRKIAVADSPFTIDNGQLTPSLKLRRPIVRELYRERLEALYGRG